MTAQSRHRLSAFALAFGAVVLLGIWWLDARPVSIPDGAVSRLQCVSYAPSVSDRERPQAVSPEQLRRDLALLAERTHCVRTYSVSGGLDQVPAVAAEFKLQVLLGAWIAGDATLNDHEIELAIETAKRHRDTVRAIVVGNEVLLRHELTPEQLALLIRRVASATGMPVTYADVWAFWLKHRVLADSVSFITVHILPYWDDVPVGIDVAMPYVHALYTEIARRFPGKRVLIGETGWPSAGRPRGPAVPGRVAQARYVREFTLLAERRGIEYNVIEAFDQPWKAAHEGTVGGHWGLYDGERREKFPWSGPVSEAPQGRTVVAAALLAGALGAGGALLRGGRDRLRLGLVMGSAAALLVCIGAWQLQYLLAGNITTLDWLTTLAVAAVGWLAFGIAVRALATETPARDPMPPWLALMLLVCCAYVSLGLVFAGRHRDFPVWLFLPGALGLAITAGLNPLARAAGLRARRATEPVVLATWLVAAGLLIPLLERFQNLRALGWSVTTVLLGSAILLPLALQAREHQRAAEHADAGPGKAVEHHADRADGDGEVRREG